MGDLYNNPAPSTSASPQEPDEKELPEYYLPEDFGVHLKLRACMNCGLLKTFQQFRDEGCDNCELVFLFKENPERITIFTSLKFDGIVGLTEHNHSWKTRLTDIGDKFCAGIYALNVHGRIPDHILQEVLAPAYGMDDDYYCQCDRDGDSRSG